MLHRLRKTAGFRTCQPVLLQQCSLQHNVLHKLRFCQPWCSPCRKKRRRRDVPLGTEAWADYRRTGYPRLFPVVVNNNPDITNLQLGARRMTYPLEEYEANGETIRAAVDQWLGLFTVALPPYAQSISRWGRTVTSMISFAS